MPGRQRPQRPLPAARGSGAPARPAPRPATAPAPHRQSRHSPPFFSHRFPPRPTPAVTAGPLHMTLSHLPRDEASA